MILAENRSAKMSDDVAFYRNCKIWAFVKRKGSTL